MTLTEGFGNTQQEVARFCKPMRDTRNRRLQLLVDRWPVAWQDFDYIDQDTYCPTRPLFSECPEPRKAAA